MRKALFLLPFVGLVTATSLTAQPRLGSLDEWFAGTTAPGSAGGGVTVRVGISPTGSVARCEVVYRTAPAAVASRTCEIIRNRAQYGASGGGQRPTPDEFAVRWEGFPLRPIVALDYGGAAAVTPSGLIGDRDYNAVVARVGEADVPLRFAIGPTGRIAACRPAAANVDADLARYSCALLIARARFRMPADEQGRPVSTEGRMTIAWRRPARQRRDPSVRFLP